MIQRPALVIACMLAFAAGPSSAWAQSQTLNKFQGQGADSKATAGPPIAFFADLSADEESAVTESPGKGRIDFILDRPTLRLSWTLTYSALTSPVTSASIHGPQTPGGEAGALINLAPQGVKTPLESSAILNEGELEYLLTGRLYVNIHTVKYPAGELRGQLQRLRRKKDAPTQ